MVSVRNAPTAEEILADMKEEDESLPHVRHDKDWERRTWIYGFLRAGLTEFYIHGKRYVITNKEIIEEYQRMKKERDYVRTLNLNIGSGLRMLKDELYVKEANLKKYMWLHNLTDDFTHDL
jgi:hypothetical protein